jgi:hypothetical protein
MSTLRARLILSAALALVGCGGLSVDTPVDLQVTTYPANTPFTLTLTMQACRDACATYEEAECSVSVKADNVLEVDASVQYDRTVDEQQCPNRCGQPVFAHCPVPSLGAGTYTVESGSFVRTILVK